MNILNQQKVISEFGYWPQFRDAKITKFAINSGCNRINLTIDYIDVDKNIQSEVDLAFEEICDVDLNGLFDENVIDLLSIESSSDGKMKICLDACYGLNGLFYCKSIIVL